MRNHGVVLALVLVAALTCSCKKSKDPAAPAPPPPAPTATFTATFTSTSSETPTASFTPTATLSSTPTSTFSFTATVTDTPTDSPTPTATDTPTDSPTPTPTDTPTDSPTPTWTFTATPTHTLPPFSGSEFNDLSGWATISSVGELAVVGTGTHGSCPDTSPLSGASQGYWTCSGCSGSESVTLRWTELLPAVKPDYIAIGVLSCGINRPVNIRVESSAGVKTALSTATACGTASVCDMNIYDILYIDLTATALADVRYVDIIHNGFDTGEGILLDSLTYRNGSPPPCP